jgi:hypothetical protein
MRLRGGRIAPERGDIDPAAIRGILADTFILAVDAAGEFPLRLSGTRFNAFFGGADKVGSLADLWPRSQWREMVRILAIVLDDGAAVLAGISADSLARDPVDFELLLLPLRHHGKTHARMLGCLSPSRVPIWLGLLPVNQLAITSLRIIDAAKIPIDPARHGHLMVYEGGRVGNTLSRLP